MKSYFSGLRRAIDRSFAVIEFSTDGTITTANAAFCDLMGYSASEIIGQHHSIFVTEDERQSAEYHGFWGRLADGEFQAREFCRVKKSGELVWIQATYTPITSAVGRVTGVIKLATDVTAQKNLSDEHTSIMRALDHSQAVISFDPSGKVLSANDSFAAVMGFDTPADIVGLHHSVFVPEDMAGSPEYQEFWNILRAGNFHSGEFRRRSKSGKDVWIRATYNPIRDTAGNVVKIMKFATDVTEEKLEQAQRDAQIEAISRSRAVINFTPDGIILDANQNFLEAMGYSANEIIGKHHAMFVDTTTRKSAAYKQFWNRLADGEFYEGDFQRVDRDGETVWINGVYNPIRDPDGRVIRVTKIASVITDQVAARERNDLLSLVTDRTDNSVIITDKKGLIEYVNHGFTTLTGYTLDECHGKKPGALLQGQHTDPDTVERISRHIANKEPFYEEILNYDRRGKASWISLAVNPILDSNGELIRFVSIQSNIDATKRRALEFTKKLEAISQTSAICEWAPDGSLTDMNDYLINREGAAHELKDILEAGERACVANGETLHRKVTWRTARHGQDDLILDAVFNLVRDENGVVNKVLMFGTDITNRQTAIDTALSTIRSSSEQIREITEVIESVANETRILSLNASVEASRAGEAGKGFAIVASEIRDLAGRTNGSIADISKLLEDNQRMLQCIEAQENDDDASDVIEGTDASARGAAA